uniref:glutamine-rich protein 2 n=1 Tax=Monopterus albus TaxID=43700 RepID=UPI0009B3E911|nr:glutamine-rich protein 2-like [Monopterus albus]
MKLIQELHNQRDSLKGEIIELLHQQKVLGAQAETVTAMEQCCHRVDALEEAVRSLRETFQKYPDPEELSRCVTWDVMQSALLSETENLKKVLGAQAETVTAMEQCCHRVDALEEAVRSLRETFQKYPDPEELSRCVTWDVMQSALLSETENLKKELVNTWAVDPAKEVEPRQTSFNRNFAAENSFSSTPSSPHPVEDTVRTAASGSPMVSEEIPTLLEVTNTPSATEASSDLSGPPQQPHSQTGLASAGMRDQHLQDQNVELLNNAQVILQLQAECEKLHENMRWLHEDNRQKQSHIEELYKKTEELEEKKADRQMVESEIKADKSVLESKVSRLQFDSATEHLNTMFHELLNKVMDQEQDWHKVIDKLSSEMECKLNRIELDSMKKQLEDRWKNIHKELQAQGAPEHDDAAIIRKQLLERFHCLSCDRPIVMQTSRPDLVILPSTPGFPSHKSIRPYAVYSLEQLRQHYRSKRIPERTDYGHMAVSRSCGGSHTITSASQRQWRTGLQYMKHHNQTEVDSLVQSEEVDLIGLDGNVYRGRLNATDNRNSKTELPPISTKQRCKTKDKARCSSSHKAAASPEVGHHPPSATSAQYSHSASSISGRDWPVSALGCTSQCSITAAESST